jgi:hypothetical protein
MNRFDLRAANDAAERQSEDEEEVEEEEEETEEDEEPSDEAEGEEAVEEETGGDEESDEEAPPKKRAKAKPKAPKAATAKPKRTREKKIVRMKQVWAVFNNSNQRVAAFEYPKRSDADALAAKLTADKKSTHFVQPVKEPIEEKEKKEEK